MGQDMFGTFFKCFSDLLLNVERHYQAFEEVAKAREVGSRAEANRLRQYKTEKWLVAETILRLRGTRGSQAAIPPEWQVLTEMPNPNGCRGLSDPERTRKQGNFAAWTIGRDDAKSLCERGRPFTFDLVLREPEGSELWIEFKDFANSGQGAANDLDLKYDLWRIQVGVLQGERAGSRQACHVVILPTEQQERNRAQGRESDVARGRAARSNAAQTYEQRYRAEVGALLGPQAHVHEIAAGAFCAKILRFPRPA